MGEKSVHIRDAAREIHATAVEKGFWNPGEITFGERLMLVVTEASEAMQAYKKKQDDEIPEELADIVIRVLDMAEGYGYDIEAAIAAKMQKNKARPYKHNGRL
ncbi:MAG: nucleotide pyrophosphohydrolase [Firmicutes bacterium]|nr:nucleotide pyrophosphohydrolase [Bacillota bacterium]